jgi:hypothetical protein
MKLFSLIFSFSIISCEKEKKYFGTIIEVPNEVKTLKEAIELSKKNDTILLQPGIYNERNISSNHAILITSLYYLTGDTNDINNTIIGGEGHRRRFFFDNLSDSIKLNGFTIEDGGESMAPGNINSEYLIDDDYVGGGIYCNNSKIILKNMIISDNAAGEPNSRGTGGGLYIKDSYVYMENIVIKDNYALRGGGAFYCEYSTLKLYNSHIYNNRSWRGDPPISIRYSDIDFKNVLFEDNVNMSTEYPEEIGIGFCTGILDNVTIINDSISIFDGSLTIINSNIPTSK